MKNTIKFTLLFVFIFTIGSCSDDEFLVQKSPDQLTTDNFWRNYKDALSGLTAAYSELESRSNFWTGWQEGRPVVEWFRSDYVLPGPDASNYSHWMSIYHFNYTNGHVFFDVLWRTNYRGLNFSNQVISNVSKMTEDQITAEQKKQIIGEATFLRGYYHFKLLTLFEKIIIRNEVISSETINKSLSTRLEAWKVVLQDFKKAAQMLDYQVAPVDLGRATKGAALAYLGKAYLYKSGDPSSAEPDDFTNAANAFETIVNDGIYTLEPDFASIFNGENENNQGSIFELQFKSADATSDNATRLHSFIADWSLGGWGGIEASMALVDEMKSEGKIASNGLYDNRLYASVYFKSPYYNDLTNPRMQGYTWDFLINETYGDPNAKDNSVYFRKWLPKDIWNSGYIGLNVVLMRYADVLLMYAESIKDTNIPKAESLINKVRAVHGNMPPVSLSTSQEVQKQIVHERTMELTLESVRFFDLRRWGMLEEVMNAAGRTGFNVVEHAYLPVPLAEIQNNTEIP